MKKIMIASCCLLVCMLSACQQTSSKMPDPALIQAVEDDPEAFGQYILESQQTLALLQAKHQTQDLTKITEQQNRIEAMLLAVKQTDGLAG